ncbi:DUF5063 domain-containing protein [Allorhodopirellula solitaria]|uniref:DUF5063 domain-containing protein n=1 Tax=Allorhodopirellula solitaria TaxID=2527987 RepID=A0A5C5X209_9BACT|nr:DUF5063 domain-containing protein [Allorhodopirellula solitaria]TWT56291.1 hypothetical protein CA85_42920 [Allorhodopirellula solitaria]
MASPFYCLRCGATLPGDLYVMHLEPRHPENANLTQQIDSFAVLASSYCTLIEQHDTYTTEEFITRTRAILPQLYHCALGLPDIETTDEDVARNISHDEWSVMFTSLQRKLGINDHYWEIYDPLELDHDQPVAASLSDDLADIWRDLKTGLPSWADCSDTIRKQIVWDWHFSFHHHWSDHAVDALRAINWIAEHYGVRDAEKDA